MEPKSENSNDSDQKRLCCSSLPEKNSKERHENDNQTTSGQIYSEIYSTVVEIISKGDVDELKKMILDPLTLEKFNQGVHKLPENFNLIILACKYNQIKVLEYILYENIEVLDLFKSHQNSIKPGDLDDEGHNAFYYAIRSGNCELVRLLTDILRCDYCSWKIEDVCNSLAYSYENLKLKNVNLSDEMILLIESSIIYYRFYSNDSNNEIKNKNTLQDIIERITLIIDNIKLLVDEFSGLKIINDRFLYIARFIAQNIKLVKYSLKSTYDKIPWEEVEFFLTVFVSDRKKSRTQVKVFENFYITKDKLLKYLELFNDLLMNKKTKIRESDIGKPFKLLEKTREEFIEYIFEKSEPNQRRVNQELNENYQDQQLTEAEKLELNEKLKRELYEDYQALRDIHSLKLINQYLELAVSADPKKQEGQLIILRSLQVMGEHLKNSWEAPNMSQAVSRMLLFSFPPTTKKIMTDIRDSLVHKSKKYLQLISEENFLAVQEDIRIINTTIIIAIFTKRFENIFELNRKIIQSTFNDTSSEYLLEILNNLNLHQLDSDQENDKNHKQIISWIKKLKNIIKRNNLDDNSLTDLEKLIEESFLNHSNIEKYNANLELLMNIQLFLGRRKYISINIIDNFLKRCKLKLLSLSKNTDHRNFIKIIKNFSNLLHDIWLKIPPIDFIEVDLTTKLIKYRLGSHMHGLISIEKVACKLNEKNIELYSENKDFNDENIKLKREYEKQISVLDEIFDDELDYVKYKQDKHLQSAVEFLLLNILSILGDKKKNKLDDDEFFLDYYSPILTGKRLRNHMAHIDNITEILPVDLAIAVFVTARKLLQDRFNIFESNHRIGKCMKRNSEDLKTKYYQDLKAIEIQEEMFRALENGNLDKVKEAIKNGADINGKDFRSWTALHFVTKSTKESNDKLDIVQFVLDHNVSPLAKNNDDESALSIAAMYGSKSIVELLIKNGSIVNETDNFGKSVLYKAVEHCREEIVEILIKNNADTLVSDDAGTPPLHIAIIANYKSIVDILLKEESHVDNNECPSRITPLHVAILYGHEELAEYFIKNDANIDIEVFRNENHTSVRLATFNIDFKVSFRNRKIVLNLCVKFYKSYEQVRSLALAKLNLINSLVNYKNTQLVGVDYLVNSLSGHKEYSISSVQKTIENLDSNGPCQFVEESLKDDADEKIRNEDMGTVLHTAVLDRDIEAVHLLLKEKTSPFVKESTQPLPEKSLKDFINKKDAEGCTALHYAALTGQIQLVKLLILNGGDVTSKCNMNITPFDYSIYEGHDTVVKYILDRKDLRKILKINEKHVGIALQSFHFDIAKTLIFVYEVCKNISISKCIPLLQIAAMNDEEKIVEKLLKRIKKSQEEKSDKEYKIDLKDYVYEAVKYGHKNIVEIFYKHDPTVIKERFLNDYTLLHYAVEYNNVRVIKYLLEIGADKNAVSSQGTPLAIAVQNGFTNIVRMLLQNQADSSIDNNCFHLRPLLLAAYFGHFEIFKLLFKNDKIDDISKFGENKINVNSNFQRDITMLHLSAFTDDLSITEYLVGKGADINAVDENGLKPIHIAAYQGHINVVDYYIIKGLNINDSDSHENTLLHYAAYGKNRDLVYYLITKKLDVNGINSSGQTPLHLTLVDDSLTSTKQRTQANIKYFDHNNKSKDIIDTLNRHPTLLRVDAYNSSTVADDKIPETADKQGIQTKLKSYDFINSIKDKDSTQDVAVEIINILLSKGAVYNPIDMYNKTPFDLVNNSLYFNLFSSIDKLFQNVKDNKVKKVMECYRKFGKCNHLIIDPYEDPVRIKCTGKKMLGGNTYLNIVDKDGYTPLHYAAESGYIEVVRLLLENGAFYDKKNRNGNTPLDLCKKSVKVTKLLTIIDKSFKYVKSDDIHVIDLIERTDDNILEIVKKAQNITSHTLIDYARKQKFSNIDRLYTAFKDNIEHLMNNDDYRELFEEHERINLTEIEKKYRDKSEEESTLDTRTVRIISLGIFACKCPVHSKTAFKLLSAAYYRKKSISGKDDDNTLIMNSWRGLLYREFENFRDFGPEFISNPDEKNFDDIYDISSSFEKDERLLSYFLNALHKAEKKNGNSSILSGIIRGSIAKIYVLQKKYDSALSIYKKHGTDEFSSCSIELYLFHCHSFEDYYTVTEAFIGKKNYKFAFETAKMALRMSSNSKEKALMTKLLIGTIHYNRNKKIDALMIYKSILKSMIEFCGEYTFAVMKIRKRITAIEQDCMLSGDEEFLKYREINEAAKSRRSIAALLSRGDDINSVDQNNLTLLHHAVYNEDGKIVKFILREKADCSLRSNKGNTALHFAVNKNNKDIVYILLKYAKKGMSVSKFNDFINAKTKNDGITCMHIAARKGSEDIVNILLEYGAIYDIISNKSKTPYDLCEDSSIKHLLKSIEKIFTDVREESDIIITELKNTDVTKRAVILNARNKDGKTLLNVALTNKHEELARKILEILKNLG